MGRAAVSLTEGDSWGDSIGKGTGSRSLFGCEMQPEGVATASLQPSPQPSEDCRRRCYPPCSRPVTATPQDNLLTSTQSVHPRLTAPPHSQQHHTSTQPTMASSVQRSSTLTTSLHLQVSRCIRMAGKIDENPLPLDLSNLTPNISASNTIGPPCESRSDRS